ncbi:Fur family transcriptional regulator [Sanguibacter sp. A247]|uniref:Fur family transcriptional regulator n=1 Tax=unclassified Sanguibacter TaxID=2645534 RepID=UPI003FD7E856
MTTANTAKSRTDDEALLRSAGLRVTAPRLATLAALSTQPHASADQVIGAVRAKLGSVSVQAVYDVLHVLDAHGLIQRIEPAGHPARYERRRGDNHHHVVCRSCGAVSDVDCATGHAPCLIPSNDHGFTIDTAEVLYWGTCPSCRPTA